MAVSELDRYAFDVNCYLVLRGVLDARRLAEFNGYLDALRPEEIADREARDRALNWVFDLDRAFLDLLDHAQVLPYLVEFIDEGVRIDHAYALVSLPGENVELHGEPGTRSQLAWYRIQRGRISSGLTVVLWALTDAAPDAGGFVCIPGSHKANFDLPPEPDQLAIEVPVGAGDVIVFSEALTHGARWRGPEPRRILVYKYAPGTAAWLSDVWDDAAREGLTERQRRMTMPPFVNFRGEHERPTIG